MQFSYLIMLCLNVLAASLDIDKSLNWKSKSPYESENFTAELSKLASSLAQQYHRDCLKIAINGEWENEPHISVKDDAAGHRVLRLLKESTLKVAPRNCLVLMFSGTPSTEAMESLASGLTPRVIIVHFESIGVRDNFLLSSNLMEEQNVIGLTKKDKVWQAYMRTLYTPLGRPKLQKVFSWTPGTSIKYGHQAFPEQMKNFYGEKFIVSTLNFMPFIDYEEQEGTRVVKEKPSIDVFFLHEMARVLNFTYEIMTPNVSSWGTYAGDVS